jgi:hypothetical protein
VARAETRARPDVQRAGAKGRYFRLRRRQRVGGILNYYYQSAA